MPDIAHEPNRGTYNASMTVLFQKVGNKAVARTPKVGLTSIGRASGEDSQYPEHLLPDLEVVYAMIRDPLERFESAYNYFTERCSFPSAWDNSRPGMIQHKPSSIEAFTDLVLDNRWYDKHWMPQTELWSHYPHDNWEFRLFEDFRAVMGEVGIAVLHQNKTTAAKKGVSYRRAELEEFYAEDLALRETLING